MASSQADGAVQSESLPGVSSSLPPHGGGGGCGLKTASSIARQASIYSLTLEEFQNVLGEPMKSFGSMNMDEFLKNIWTVEESQAMAAAMGSGAAGAEEARPPFHQAITRQASMSLPRTLSQKTVDDVWKDIARDGIDMGSDPVLAAAAAGAKDRQITFGEMTLEDFLVKAGVGVGFEKGFRAAAGSRPSEKFLQAGAPFAGMRAMEEEKASGKSVPMLALSSSNGPASQGGLEPMQIEPMNHTSAVVQQSEWLPNGGFKTETPYAPSPHNILHQHAVEASARKGILGNGAMVTGLGPLGPDLGVGLGGGAMPACNSPASLVNLKTGSPQSPLLDGMGATYDALGLHSPLPYGGMEGAIVRGRKRDFEGSLEKVVERRQKRMIKNRESAARSRARKQAYTVELEAEVSHLKEENMKLRRYEEEMAERRRKQLIDVLTSFGSHFAPKPCKLRRAHTGPW